MTHYNPFGVHYYPGKAAGPVEGVVRGGFRYTSSIDSINNLYAHYAFDNRETDLPIVVLMHGYDQDASTMTSFIMTDMANYGLFAVAVGMRGRNGAGGTRDTCGRETYDIIDAVEYVKAAFSDYVNPANVNVVGYSGGGGNVFGIAAKFPDYFNVMVSHFGIADYGYDDEDSWYVTNPTRRSSIEQWIGGTPSSVPGNYQSRASQFAIPVNLLGGHLFMFHDSADTNVPVIQSQMVADGMDGVTNTRYTLSVTDPGDDPRWLHASPDANQPVRLTREMWGPPILALDNPQWAVADTGSMKVNGYLVTKKFSIWLGTGVTDVADVDYNVTSGEYTITPLTGPLDVLITQGGLTGSASAITAETTITVT